MKQVQLRFVKWQLSSHQLGIDIMCFQIVFVIRKQSQNLSFRGIYTLFWDCLEARGGEVSQAEQEVVQNDLQEESGLLSTSHMVGELNC